MFANDVLKQKLKQLMMRSVTEKNPRLSQDRRKYMKVTDGEILL